MLTLIALLVMAVQFAGAQNYEVEYKVKFDPKGMAEIMGDDKDLPAEVKESIKNDFDNAEIYLSVNMSKDKEDTQFLKDKTKFELHIMGQTLDMSSMLETMELSIYNDYTKMESYLKMDYQGTKYLVKREYEGKNVFSPAEGTRTILGHECKVMVGKDGSRIWYATDIPFEYSAYENVPGLVLAIEDEGMNSTAVRITPNNKVFSLPKDVKIVTKEEMEKIMK